MRKTSYRVIQWATGKAGQDAGDLVGLPKAGVIATNDIDETLAIDADYVHSAHWSMRSSSVTGG